jgi:hypothetical protein
MPQLHLYVAEDVAARVRARAKARGLAVSKYLAELVRRDVGGGWPEGYFEGVVGAWAGEDLERAPQGAPEAREDL